MNILRSISHEYGLNISNHHYITDEEQEENDGFEWTATIECGGLVCEFLYDAYCIRLSFLIETSRECYTTLSVFGERGHPIWYESVYINTVITGRTSLLLSDESIDLIVTLLQVMEVTTPPDYTLVEMTIVVCPGVGYDQAWLHSVSGKSCTRLKKELDRRISTFACRSILNMYDIIKCSDCSFSMRYKPNTCNCT